MQIRDLTPWGRQGSAPVRSNEADPFLSLQRDMNRMFDDFWTRLAWPGFGGDQNLGAAGGMPRADVAETENEIEVTVELPGISEKDIDVAVTGDALTIKGEKKAERKEEQKGRYLSERTYGSFYRTIPLPLGIKADRADAEFKNGVLTIRLPKSPEAQANAKKIEVKAA